MNQNWLQQKEWKVLEGELHSLSTEANNLSDGIDELTAERNALTFRIQKLKAKRLSLFKKADARRLEIDRRFKKTRVNE